MRRLLASLILTVVLVAAVPVAAFSAVPDSAAVRTSTTPVFALQSEPAVEAETEDDAAEEQPWTQRFLAPLFVILAVGAIGASGVIYMGRVKRRYTVAE